MRGGLVLCLEMRFCSWPCSREERVRGRALDLAILVAAEAREEVEMFLGAGGGDIEEARGFGVFGFGVEAGEVSICGVGVGAGGFYRSEKQTAWVPAFAWTTY